MSMRCCKGKKRKLNPDVNVFFAHVNQVGLAFAFLAMNHKAWHFCKSIRTRRACPSSDPTLFRVFGVLNDQLIRRKHALFACKGGEILQMRKIQHTTPYFSVQYKPFMGMHLLSTKRCSRCTGKQMESLKQMWEVCTYPWNMQRKIHQFETQNSPHPHKLPQRATSLSGTYAGSA